jgi:hypothetical protein
MSAEIPSAWWVLSRVTSGLSLAASVSTTLHGQAPVSHLIAQSAAATHLATMWGLVGLIDLTNLGIKIMRSQQRRLQGTRDQGLMKSFCIVHWLHEASLPEVVDNFLASSTSSRPSTHVPSHPVLTDR